MEEIIEVSEHSSPSPYKYKERAPHAPTMANVSKGQTSSKYTIP